MLSSFSPFLSFSRSRKVPRWSVSGLLAQVNDDHLWMLSSEINLRDATRRIGMDTPHINRCIVDALHFYWHWYGRTMFQRDMGFLCEGVVESYGTRDCMFVSPLQAKYAPVIFMYPTAMGIIHPDHIDPGDKTYLHPIWIDPAMPGYVYFPILGMDVPPHAWYSDPTMMEVRNAPAEQHDDEPRQIE